MTRAGLLVAALAACGPRAIAPGPARALAAPESVTIERGPLARRHAIAPEDYLRAYLAWFGGASPLDVQQQARKGGMFDSWDDYLAALGLPDYRIDLPRQEQTNTLMLAALGRLGEALCVRAAERDLLAPPASRSPTAPVVFAFARTPAPPTDDEFAARFDVLHRLFLSYPARLAPPDRVPRYHALWTRVHASHAARPAKQRGPLPPDVAAWVAVCSALVRHPEAELY